MDATYRTNSHNYCVLGLVVVDEHGSGVPVAFGITSSSEGAAEVKKFIEDVEAAVGGGFKIKRFLIDKHKVC